MKQTGLAGGHLLFFVLLVLLLLAATAATSREAGGRLLLKVYNEPCPALLLVPLEASEVGRIELIIRLSTQVSNQSHRMTPL